MTFQKTHCIKKFPRSMQNHFAARWLIHFLYLFHISVTQTFPPSLTLFICKYVYKNRLIEIAFFLFTTKGIKHLFLFIKYLPFDSNVFATCSQSLSLANIFLKPPWLFLYKINCVFRNFCYLFLLKTHFKIKEHKKKNLINEQIFEIKLINNNNKCQDIKM